MLLLDKSLPEGRRWKQTGWTNKLAVLLILSFLILTGTPAYAASVDDDGESLLDILHAKGTLTDEEYEQLKKSDSMINKILKALGGLSVGTLAYVEYSYGEEQDGSYNHFAVTRGYINIKKKLTPWLGFRVTPDAHQEDNGDFKLRLKYLYAEFSPPDIGFFTNMVSEVGIGHMPWLDFEEHINPYRCQGTMFIERAKTFNSADIGVSIRGYFGDKLGKDYQKRVSKYYAGRYGSWHLGVYNGGGYHAVEDNKNKVPEWRITLRPLPDFVPGLQLSYFGLYGRGGEEDTEEVSPRYAVNQFMLSYQNAWIIFTGQYAIIRGNNKGALVVPDTSRALWARACSFFFNTKLPVLDRKLNLFARYDHFDPDTKDWVVSGKDDYDLVNGGLAWEFFHHWYLMVVYERIFYQENNGGTGKAPELGNDLVDDWKVQTVLQIKFP